VFGASPISWAVVERCARLTDPRLPAVLAPGRLPLFDLDAALARPTALVLQVAALGDSMLPFLALVLAALQTELMRRTRNGQRLSAGSAFWAVVRCAPSPARSFTIRARDAGRRRGRWRPRAADIRRRYWSAKMAALDRHASLVFSKYLMFFKHACNRRLETERA
jgi:hypothetical protein